MLRYMPPLFSDCQGNPWSVSRLNVELDEAVEDENYEYAAKIRDRIKDLTPGAHGGSEAHGMKGEFLIS